MNKTYSYTIELKDKASRSAKRAQDKVQGLDKSMDKARKSTTGFNRKLDNVRTQTRRLPRSINQLESELEDLKRAQKNAFSTKEIRQYQKEIDSTQKRLNRANRAKTGGGLSAAKSSMLSSAPALASVANPYTAAAAGVAALGTGMYKATKMAMDFKKGMSKVNGTLQLSQSEIDTVSQKVKKMAVDSTTNINKVPQAFYKIVSATGGDLPASLDILKSSLKGAETGFGDLNLISDATVSVMNSVGRESTSAKEVMDTLFATLNKGKMEFRELSQYLPELIPFSKNLGISFQKTAGAFAFLTANGLKAEQTTTALKNTFNQLSKSDIRKNFRNIGVEIFNAQGKMRDFEVIAKELDQSMAGLTDQERIKKFESLGLNQEAALGFSIMANKADSLADSIDYASNSSGELKETIKKTGNPQRKLNKLANQFRGVFMSIGKSLLPGVNSALEWMLNSFKSARSSIKKAYKQSELFRDLWWGIKGVFKLVFLPLRGVYEGLKLLSKPMKTFLGWLDKGYMWIKDKILVMVDKLKGTFQNIHAMWMAMTNSNLNITEAREKLKAPEENKEEKERKQKDKQDIAGATKAVMGGMFNASGKTKNKSKDENGVNPNALLNKSGDDGGNQNMQDGIKSVAGGGSKNTNITIKLEKFQDNINIYTEQVDEGLDDMQGKIEETLLRVINSANAMS